MKVFYKRRISWIGLLLCTILLIMNLSLLTLLTAWLIPNNWSLIAFLKTITSKMFQEVLVAISPFLILVTVAIIFLSAIHLFNTTFVVLKIEDNIDV